MPVSVQRSLMRPAFVLALAVTLACTRAPDGAPSAKSSKDSAAPQTSRTVVEQVSWSGTGCTRGGCHTKIEPIRQPDSEMMKKILALGAETGDADGCVVCHGGIPAGISAKEAHAGTLATLQARGGPDDFYADPASPWVNPRTCGQCHETHVATQWNSLMMTESGKTQGTAWAFGSLSGYDHKWGNYDTKNPDDPHARVGTDDYRAYMREKAAAHPNIFQSSLVTLPRAPGDPSGGLPLDELARQPEQAVFTYIRTECNRCHLGVKGRYKRGDYRGMGCGACHMPYGVEGYYEGHDETIPRTQPGHMLVHSIQASRDAPLSVNGIKYTGIPVETCATCHNRGKRIGVSYQGLMESAYDSPFTEGGGGQLSLHTKNYLAMQKDIHYQKGMFCQDCHTSGDVHGDGFLSGTNLGGVEVECTDCHGTPTAFPWELPLGWGDENGPGEAKGAPRGVARDLPRHLKQGWIADAPGGWLRSARGNPMPKVTRDGDHVLVHTSGGVELRLETLKAKLERGALSAEAKTAMVNVPSHVQNMECYTCHTAWAPQCYGCHVKIDYSSGKTTTDWVQAGHEHLRPERRTAKSETGFGTSVPGVTTELRSYLRWEDPALGVNGEGRVTPLVPGCQVSATIIGPDGKELLRNHIFRTAPGTEGSGPEGQLGSDMSPIHPHTVGKARTCESCHSSEKAMGYGIGGGKMAAPMSQGSVIDLETQEGRVLSRHARYQVDPIAGLADWSQVVTRDGKQTQTVDHHFPGAGPLSAEQRARMERQNVCVGCHQNIPNDDPAISLLHHVAEHTNGLPQTNAAHASMLSKITRTVAWTQLFGGLGAGACLLVGMWVVRRRRAR